jgi:hypothetical protein
MVGLLFAQDSMALFRWFFVASLLLAQADRFSGTFSNDVFTLELRRDGAGYAGTIRAEGETMPVRAAADGDRLTGSFGAGGQTFRFEATRSAGGIVLVSGGDRYELREVGAKPAAAPAAAEAPAGGVAGDWQAGDGVLSLRADGTAMWGANRYRYVVKGNQIYATGGPEGMQVFPFQLSGDTLVMVVDGTPLRLTRRAAGQGAGQAVGQGNVGAELVGKWCKVTNFNANGAGAYNSSACIVLNGNGSFLYGAETDSYNPNGGVTSQTSDSGTWTATAASITANSRLRGGPVTFRLERRNHPKTGDPMIVLDGDAYVTFYQKAPWR